MKNSIAWWDKLGKPQYGGEMVIRMTNNIVNFDPYFSEHLPQIYSAWMERMHSEDWTVDPGTFDYRIVSPPQFLKGLLAESWEFPDLNTYVVHIHKGIHWQNISPVN